MNASKKTYENAGSKRREKRNSLGKVVVNRSDQKPDLDKKKRKNKAIKLIGQQHKQISNKDREAKRIRRQTMGLNLRKTTMKRSRTMTHLHTPIACSNTNWIQTQIIIKKEETLTMTTKKRSILIRLLSRAQMAP